MVEVTLTIYSPAGSREYQMAGGELSIGRGDVTLKLEDDGLSRHHATLYREGARVWILDEASTNGTFVNGAPVPASGTPLTDGDEITLGNDTTISVSIRQALAPVAKSKTRESSATAAGNSTFNYWPIVIALAAVFVILIAALAIGSRLSGNKNSDEDEVANERRPPRRSAEELPQSDSGNGNAKPSASTSPADSLPPDDSSSSGTDSAKNIPPAGKTYLAMTEDEKKKFIEQRAEHVARMIGNRGGEAVTPEAVLKIKSFVDTYAIRVKSARPTGGCTMRHDLRTLLERGSKNAPFVVHAFNEKGVDPQIGLYLAMIESEYCVCLQSPTGPLGMYQFTQATGRTYGLRIVPGASPGNPDERCQPEAAARAAAGYVKFLIGRYGTGPLSVPLAIASYNSGEGGLSTNLSTALNNAMQEERSFWTLVANQGKLSAQFQKENIKYVPKFFAAAIVGENPQVFGVQMQPLSSYTQGMQN